MAARVHRRHLLRDLPHAYVVLFCATVGVSLLMFLALYSSPARRESAVKPQMSDVEIDRRYAGSIMVDPPRGDMCWERILDNRTGKMWDNGYVKCPEVSAPSKKHQPSGIDASRLRDVGKAFRHE
jgi:hypothetical protein